MLRGDTLYTVPPFLGWGLVLDPGVPGLASVLVEDSVFEVCSVLGQISVFGERSVLGQDSVFGERSEMSESSGVSRSLIISFSSFWMGRGSGVEGRPGTQG